MSVGVRAKREGQWRTLNVCPYSCHLRYARQMAKYELLLLGSPTDDQTKALTDRVSRAASDFGMTMPEDVAIRSASDAHLRDIKAASAALYFGGDPSVDAKLVDELEAAKLPVVPVVPVGGRVEDTVPPTLGAINAFFAKPGDGSHDALAAVALECLGLLRRQRRVFVSYRRNESRAVAVQLHDELSGRGFDVFLDTHDIRPGDQFQEMLWHRLADCDVVIMLDTKDYFGSKWTTQELGRSLAQGIHILRLIWPGHDPTRHLTLSDAVQLVDTDFEADGKLTAGLVDSAVERVEVLRSRSVATRLREIAGKLRIEVERLGGTFEGIGAHRAIAITLPNGLELQAYPVVGVPTAEILNDIHEKARAAGHGRFPCLVYDGHGIRPSWHSHLRWLDEQVKEVRALRVFDAAWELAEWDS